VNVQQESPRRLLTWLEAAAGAVALIVALLFSPGARAANYTDIWWNPSESGWGLTLSHHGDQIFGVWYIYGTDGKPLWVVMSDGVFSNNGRTFTGSIYRTTGTPYTSPVFYPSQTTVGRVGTARIDFDADDENATVTYNVGATNLTKRVTRQSFGNAPANFGVDRSDLWWDPNESGWGLTLSHHGDQMFGVWYTYGENREPLWIVLPGGVTSGNTFSGTLFTTTGSPYTAAFNPGSTLVTEVGNATITFSGDTATFVSTVKGVKTTKQIRRQSFGAETPNQKPTIGLSLVPGATPLIAPGAVTLRATPRDNDGTVAKVTFFQGCTMIGEKTSAPWEFPVQGLASGKYSFSARVTDNAGGTALATAPAVEVKTDAGTGGGGPAGNALPTVSLTSPANNAQFTQGNPIALAATAADTDGTIAKVEFFAGSDKIGESTAAPFTASWTSATVGTHTLTARATDDKGGYRVSAAVTVVVLVPPVVYDSVTRDITRFLTQATFGIRGTADIEAVRAVGYDAWLSQQFAMPVASHVQYVRDRLAAGEKADEERAYEAIWQQWLWDPGQLRARMTFALSEIFVVSNIAPDLDTYGMASYMDMLNRNAFGNYRQLLEEVTLHPTMGYYLNMQGSKKADPAKGTHPNENYAREVMQLFSIGLYKLNPDGSRMLVGGAPVNTYDQSVIEGMAAAFSGWNFAGNDTSNAAIFNPAKENWQEPMLPWEMWHDTNPKTIFDGIVIPGGQSARADLKATLDALANHPNVGPFIGRQLIQRFVTSNPSPAYIARVAAAFANNGAGVRGDLRATLRAVLLDPDARDLNWLTVPTWGKQREPVIRFANFLRALGATSTSGRNRIWYLDSADEGLGQSPLLAPSVFNFFSPNYRQPGALSAANLVAPEFQITTETSMVGGLNFFSRLVRNGGYGSGDTRLTLNVSELNPLANTPGLLADRLNLLFFNGAMSDATRSTIISTLNAMALTKTGDTSAVTDRLKAALILVSMAPDFVIQK
jgi:uncharacterized protein (DUF1800 family)